ncbi:hypothetical protein [Larkinella sp. C7]|jgi:hypothetical protein|uniref:hypothetical protein n=1 Tax=Larkinella sp. C7 TaxID=2576607 RepID=UPI0011112631|nr:hypothetical protein [Larkinella sp. C7]
MKTISTLLFSILLLSGLSSAIAQQTTYSQEDSMITTGELKRFYRYITRANVEEKTLFKLGFWPNAGDRDFTGRPSFRIGLNADVSVERKLTPSFSVMGGFDFMLRYNKYDQFAVPYYNNGTYIDTDRMFRGFVYAKVGTRFYYDMAKRIREGKAANNFSGNYIGIQYTRALSVRVIEHRYDTKTGSSVGTNNYDIGGAYGAPLLSAMWGFQRRIGRRGFVDLNVGPEITIPKREKNHLYGPGRALGDFYKNTYGPSLALRVNAVIGLGW